MKRRLKSLVTLLFACSILVGFAVPVYSQEKSGPAQPPAQSGKQIKRPERYPTALAGLEVLADLSVTPNNHAGQCPTSFTFKGKITVNRPTMVQYRFIRSDNTRHALGVLDFKEAGTKEVTDTWVFDDPAQLPNFRGWEAIQINLPMKLQSNLAYFQGNCTEYKGGPATPQKPQETKSLSWPQPDPQIPSVKR